MKALHFYMIFFFFSCNTIPKKEKGNDICFADKELEKIKETSFKEIYSDSLKNRKFVKVIGRFSFNFENVALYPDRNSNTSQSLWLNFSDSVSNFGNELEKINGEQISAMGIIDFTKKGHLGSYFGTLDSVFCIRLK